MKNSNATIGNRTCDLPACSAVPQPTAPPRAPIVPVTNLNKYLQYGKVELNNMYINIGANNGSEKL